MDAATLYEVVSRHVMELGSDPAVVDSILDSVWAEAHQARNRALNARRVLNGHIKEHGCDVLLADESTIAGDVS